MEISYESLPLTIIINDYTQEYNENLDYINFIPSIKNINNELKINNLKNYINTKLYRMCAYYNEFRMWKKYIFKFSF